MKKKNIKVNDINISYIDNCTKNPKKTVFVLAPGIGQGSFLEKFLLDIPKEVRIISPDYPGRGDSGIIKNNSFSSIAKYMVDLITELNLQDNLVLLGISYGSAVANEMLQISNNYTKIILIGPGEFFTEIQKISINILFLPASLSEGIRKIYRKLVLKKIPGMKEGLYNCDLKSILKQWKHTLRYKINESSKIKIPTTIIHFKNDPIIKKNSLLKLRNSYVNVKELTIEIEHTLNLDEIIKSGEIEKNIEPILLKEI